MQKLKVGDYVDENGRIGQVVNIASAGTADVKFDDMAYPIRRQERDLVIVRKNPMTPKLKRVPSYIKKTKRSNATNIYAIPERQSFPIGDLYHARLALTYVLSPSNYDSRAQVIQAVQQSYPEYNWDAWWDQKRKGTDLFSWDEYLEDYRMVDGEPRQVANPFFLEESIPKVPNPRKPAKVDTYDPTEAQFQAVVQGIYESLIKQRVGAKYSTPFKDEFDVRLDVKAQLPSSDIRDILGSAFAIATRQGQKQGTLRQGTQKATAKGIRKSKARAKDTAHLRENILDYETTLMLARKDQDFRIVKRGSKYYVSPTTDAFRSSGYKRKQDAQSAITRYLKSLDDDFPSLNNPAPIPDRSPQAEKQMVRYSKQSAKASTYRKAKSTKGAVSNYERKLSYAKGVVKEGKTLYEYWASDLRSKGFTGAKLAAELRKRVDNINLSRYTKGDEEFARGPIYATVEQKYVYLPEMTNKGEPYILYRRAPIASYYTIKLTGPSYKFNFGGSVVLDRNAWRSPIFGENGFNLKSDTVYMQYDEDGTPKGQRQGKSLGVASVQFSPGLRLSPQNGFNRTAIMSATRSVIDAYGPWYESHKEELKKDEPKLRFPTDCLTPTYDEIRCNELRISTIDPFQHFGIFLNALVQVLEFKDALEIRDRGQWLDLYSADNSVIRFLKRKGILKQVQDAIQGDTIRLQQSLTSERKDTLEKFQNMSTKEIERFHQFEKGVDQTFKPLFKFLSQTDPKGADKKLQETTASLQKRIENVKLEVLKMFKQREPIETIRSYVGGQFNEMRTSLQKMFGLDTIPPDISFDMKELRKYIFGQPRQPSTDRETRQKRRSQRYRTTTTEAPEETRSNPRRRKR